MQDNTQEGFVDADLAIVLDEAQFPEFVHEKIDPGPRCADHLRQHLLRYFGNWSSSEAIWLLPSQIRTCGFPAYGSSRR